MSRTVIKSKCPKISVGNPKKEGETQRHGEHGEHGEENGRKTRGGT
jgi:hypothetical protein